MLRETIKIDNWTFGTRVEYMDLDMYKGSRFYECGIFDVGLHQKPENKFLYLPDNSGHDKHTISNYVCGELKRYIRENTKEIIFLAVKVKFFRRLLDGGFKKRKLVVVFNTVKYSDRVTLLLPKKLYFYCWFSEEKLRNFFGNIYGLDIGPPFPKENERGKDLFNDWSYESQERANSHA